MSNANIAQQRTSQARAARGDSRDAVARVPSKLDTWTICSVRPECVSQSGGETAGVVSAHQDEITCRPLVSA
jgi:hypothetical protein